MQIVLTALDEPLAAAWEGACGGLPGINIVRGSILDVPCDAVVSPANSFGFMDGGIDMVYLHYFGAEIQMTVRRAIAEQHAGELLVGQAEIVETGDAAIPYLIAAPTMRVPMVLEESVAPYLAARAVLLLIAQGRFPTGPRQGEPVAGQIKTVAFPGLGTGVGRIKPEMCAHQFRRAFDDVQGIIAGTHRLPPTWIEAQAEHRALHAARGKSGKKGRLW